MSVAAKVVFSHIALHFCFGGRGLGENFDLMAHIHQTRNLVEDKGL